jgi:spore maturation protein CgeB
MKIVLFYHSLVSDWNHGNAHFLRGVAHELRARGHEVDIYEPLGGWSRSNLIRDHGEASIERFHRIYPLLDSRTYEPDAIDLDAALDGSDLVIVHEWNDEHFVARVGEHRQRSRHYRLLFHDTHHRALADRNAWSYDLSGYDGVLAFGRSLRDLYLSRGWCKQAFVWHEGADTRIFRPLAHVPKNGGLVFIGNWGDGERTAELRDMLLSPVRALRIDADVYGVRYPVEAIRELSTVGMRYQGFLPNYEVPRVFADHRLTVHVPRRSCAETLPGIPSIRVFEALACGIPLVCAPWSDAEELFRPGLDYLVAKNAQEMTEAIRSILSDPALASSLSKSGQDRILSRHTCSHRVDELLAIFRGARK